MPRYSKKAQDSVREEMHEYKRGRLKSHGKRVKKRSQAIAIGLSKARKKGAKVPKKATTTKKKHPSRKKSKK